MPHDLKPTVEIKLDDADWARFQAALAEPATVNPKLAALLRSTPRWATNIVQRASKKKTPGAGATEVQKVKPRA